MTDRQRQFFTTMFGNLAVGLFLVMVVTPALLDAPTTRHLILGISDVVMSGALFYVGFKLSR